MKYVIILNDPPYGTERSYNGLRVANALTKNGQNEVAVFLMGDAASCAASGQVTPNGYYNIERMIKIVTSKGGKVGICGTCMDARGLNSDTVVDGAHRSTMDELTSWTESADKVIVF